MKQASTVVLTANQKLVGVQKEWHTRKQRVDGVRKHVCYLAVDRLAVEEPAVILTQKLPWLRDFINARAINRGGHISTTALYNGADRSTESRGTEFIKGRWRVTTVDLTRASDAFESARKANTHTGIIVASEQSCYVVA
jgi:hypothetical protein